LTDKNSAGGAVLLPLQDLRDL